MPIYTEFRQIRSLLGIPLGALLISCQPDPVEGQFHFISLQPGIDLDGDGVQGGLDCDDEDAAISPRMVEIPYDGLDQDCSGADLVDVDEDGAASELVGGLDCDDQDPSRAPTRLEIVNDGIDQDCSGADAVDADGDGFVAGPEDCDDASPDAHVGALELIDLSDNDCDGQIDEVPYSGVYNLTQLPSILTSTIPGAQFGFSLSPGGSASPPSTLLVGAPGSDQVLLLRLSALTASGSDGLDTLLTLEGPTGAGVGQGPNLATDLNADGWPELLLSAPTGEAGGALYLLTGEPWKTSITLSLESSAVAYRAQMPQEALGSSLFAAGDLTGDGYHDVWVGAPGAKVGTNGAAGAVYMLPGGAQVTRKSGVLADISPISILGEQAELHVGAALSGGDLDGDGVAELVVGAPSEVGSLFGRGGQVAVLRRGAGWTGSRWFSESSLLLTDDSGDATRAQGGVAVEAGADLNGDGVADLVVAAPGASGGGTSRGKVYIWWGGTALVAGVLPFSSADVILQGTEDQEQLGAQLTRLSDLNGDGVDDLALGAPGRSRVYVLYGRVAGWIRQAVINQVAVRVEDTSGSAGLGVSMTGLDMNEDGKVELLMGVPFALMEQAVTGGSVYVLPGLDNP